MQPYEFDLIYFVFITMVMAFIWWWCCSDQQTTCWQRRRPVSNEAEIASQREILTLQLQEDLRELRLQRQQNGAAQDTSSLDPATAEELAKIQLERRKGIKAQLKCREYQTTVTNENTPETTATTAKAATTIAPGCDEEECEGACNICLNEFQQGEEVSDASNPECRHFFHTECVIDWLLRNRICPICRRDFLQAEDPC